jgi:uncharacterized protein (TIGR03437 family)
MMARGSGLLPYVLFFLAPFSLAAQGPDVGRNGVFNAASATPLALSGGEIARGALLAVTGVRLGTDAAGTAVRLAGSWGAMPLTLVSVSPTRIEARVPPAVPLGPATLTVTASGQSSRAVPVRVVAAQFGAYSRIRNLPPWGARTANSPNQAAAPGEAVVLEGTGLGSATAPQVFIGGKRGTLVSVRRGTTGKAADEIAVRIPAGAPEGCFVPVQVRGAGRLPSNIVTVAIHRGGGSCSPLEAIPFASWAGSRTGFVAVARVVWRDLGATDDVITDEAGASFARLPQTSGLPPFFLPPPPGTCVSQVQAAGDTLPQPNPVLDLLLSGAAEGPLRAGPELAINDGQIQQKIRPVEGVPGVYYSKFSARGPGGAARVLPHFLSPSRLTLSGSGGDAGPFRVALPGPEPFAITSRLSSVDRARGATLRWDQMGADRFAIVALSFVDPVTFTTGSCYCVADPGATAIAVPPEALANFPAVSPAEGGAKAFLTVISWPVEPVSFSAAGLDHGLGISAFVRSWEVTLR